MFESADLEHKVGKEEYKREEPQLREALLNAQFDLGAVKKFPVLIIIGGDSDDNLEFFQQIEIVGRTHSPYAMPYENGLEVSIARRPRINLREAWAKVKMYI